VKQKRQVQHRPDIDSYDQKVSALASLEEFSSDAFVPDDEQLVALCRFIFALAAIHNDFNDVGLALTLLNFNKPSGEGKIDRPWGLFGGLSLHCAKAKIAIVHELLNVIRDNTQVLSSKSFVALLKKLNREQREAWEEVIDAAKGESHETPLGKYLARCRDKTAGHYDLKALYNAFNASMALDPTMKPLISRGNSLLETRFYFADRAVENIILGTDPDAARVILFTADNLLSRINLALFLLVTRFINSRTPFKPVVEGAEPAYKYWAEHFPEK
jgi:hypothetical protein